MLFFSFPDAIIEMPNEWALALSRWLKHWNEEDCIERICALI
jgi:hypothetical protein